MEGGLNLPLAGPQNSLDDPDINARERLLECELVLLRLGQRPRRLRRRRRALVGIRRRGGENGSRGLVGIRRRGGENGSRGLVAALLDALLDALLAALLAALLGLLRGPASRSIPTPRGALRLVHNARLLPLIIANLERLDRGG